MRVSRAVMLSLSMSAVYAPALLAQAQTVAQSGGANQSIARKTLTVKETLLMPTFGGYQLSPNGQRILFTRTDRDEKEYAATTHLYVHDVAAKTTMQLTSSAKGESNPRWLPDGRVLFSSNRDTKASLWVISPSGGEATKYLADPDAPNGTLSPDYSHIVFTEATDRPDKKEWDDRVKKKDDGYFAEKKLTYTHVWVYDVASKKKMRLTSGDFDHAGPVWSPDGKVIAYTSNRTNTTGRDARYSNNSDIYLVPADSGALRQLTTHEGPDRSPTFSPDGRQIAYLSSEQLNSGADQTDVKVIPSAGGAPLNLTADYDYSVSNVDWSTDGKFLYFSAAEGLTQKLYRIAPTGGKPVLVQFGDDFMFGSFNVTDDGTKWLVTGSTLASAGIVYLTEPDGRKPRRVLVELDRYSAYDVGRSETLTWKGADGWDIEGVITYPVNYQPGTRVPLILQVHGGPHGRFTANFNTGAQIWAARGYAVLQTNPRGSSGRTLAFSNANSNDWGGKDYIDIMNGVDHVIAKGVADPDKMAIMGGSYGGFMTFWTVTQTSRFKAAIGHAGIVDWYSFYGQTDIPNLLEHGFGGMPTASKATYEKWSPIEYATNVTTPLLITHGEEDERVPISQGEQYFRTLKKLEKPVEFLRFPREGHGIAEPLHRIYLDAEQEKWFAKYVLGRTTRPISDN